MGGRLTRGPGHNPHLSIYVNTEPESMRFKSSDKALRWLKIINGTRYKHVTYTLATGTSIISIISVCLSVGNAWRDVIVRD